MLKQHLPSLEALCIKDSGLFKGGGEDGMGSEVKDRIKQLFIYRILAHLKYFFVFFQRYYKDQTYV